MLLIVYTVPALAAGTVAVLSADDISATTNTILVPVNISNNPGIMGFRVSASYPSELLEISSVAAGRVTTKGNFIHNAGKVSGQVDIIWYATEQTTENGSLFVLTVQPTEKFIEGESTQITLSFSQADTFNEKYEDVAFDCEPINISYGIESEQTSSSAPDQETATDTVNTDSQGTSKSEQTQETVAEAPVTDAQIIDAVDAALANTETGRIDDIDSGALAEVNDNLRTIAGPNAPQFSSTEELKEQYKAAKKNEYMEQAKINLEPSVISNTLTGVLDRRNAASYSELSESEKGNAVTEAYQKMHDADKTLPNISDILTVDESAEMFDSMISDVSTENEETESEKEAGKGAGFPVYIIIFIAAVVICCVVAFVVYKKSKAKEATDNKGKE